MFTDKEHRGPFEFSDELSNLSIGADAVDTVVPAQQVDANDKDLLLSTSEKEDGRALSSNGSAYSAPLYDAPASVPTSQIQSDLVNLASGLPGHVPAASFAIDDLLGLGLSVTPAPAPSPPPLSLNPKAVLDPGTFQQKWRQLPISLTQVFDTVLIDVNSLLSTIMFNTIIYSSNLMCYD